MAYRAITTIWHYARFLSDRSNPDRWLLYRGYLKVLFWLTVWPRRKRPLKLFGFRVYYPSLWLLRHLYSEVLLTNDYRQRAAGRSPRIVDAGANIGLAALYLLRQNPKASIVCIEPDGNTATYLEENLRRNGFRDVTIIRKALSDKVGTVTLYGDPAFAGDTTQSISRTFRKKLGPKGSIRSQRIPATTLGPILTQPADILKVDIEGSEVLVLRAAQAKLKNVRTMLLEFHHLEENSLAELLQILDRAGFTYALDARKPVSNALGSTAMIRATRR
ncbi:MAG: FkbM family methyltransferase [bacterium]|nr:FkbM family methyltransferase [bacterium]